MMWLRTGFDCESEKKNHRTESTVDTEGRNRMGFERELLVWVSLQLCAVTVMTLLKLKVG